MTGEMLKYWNSKSTGMKWKLLVFLFLKLSLQVDWTKYRRPMETGNAYMEKTQSQRDGLSHNTTELNVRRECLVVLAPSGTLPRL